MQELNHLYLDSIEVGPFVPLAFRRVFVTDIPSQDVEESLRRRGGRLASVSTWATRPGKPISKVLPETTSLHALTSPAVVQEPLCLDAFRDSHIRLNSDCIPVLGAIRAAVYDLTRCDIHLFPAAYYDLLRLMAGQKVSTILDHASPLQVESILQFVRYLFLNELVNVNCDPERFPDNDLTWDAPGRIDNAIIDVDLIRHDFDSILEQLDCMGCRHVQLRCYSSLLSIADLDAILQKAASLSLETVELVVRFEPSIGELGYKSFLLRHPIVASMTVHTAPLTVGMKVDYGSGKLTHPIARLIRFTENTINSENACGVIVPSFLNTPTFRTFAEANWHNGCLNKKISVDRYGEIRNCPSMVQSFGNISNVTLQAALDAPDFRQLWNLRKDMIDTCQACEFRYACSDCRAYLKDPSNRLSKPEKCRYNPFTAEWDS